MLCEAYIEALLVDEALADQVWEAWDKGKIEDQMAWLAWWFITLNTKQSKILLLSYVDNNEISKMRRATP